MGTLNEAHDARGSEPPEGRQVEFHQLSLIGNEKPDAFQLTFQEVGTVNQIIIDIDIEDARGLRDAITAVLEKYPDLETR